MSSRISKNANEHVTCYSDYNDTSRGVVLGMTYPSQREVGDKVAELGENA